jgi:hypothetical protein
MHKSKRTKQKTFCDWATAPFVEFLDHQEDLNRILTLSARGIQMLRGRVKAIEVLQKFDVSKDSGASYAEKRRHLKEAKEEARLAQAEVDNDFPILHEQATVALWSALEALVKTFAATWLTHRPDAWQVEAIKRLKVKLGDFLPLDVNDRALWVVDLLDQEASGPLRNGIMRFESLLQVFGLDGQVPEDCRRSLFELSQIRHVIVHRRGFADRRLMEACPWIGLAAGQRIKISHKMWNKYDAAVGQYVLELIQRVRCKLGLGRYEPVPACSDVQQPPNKSLQPTATAVTPPASAGGAPSVAVAEH